MRFLPEKGARADRPKNLFLSLQSDGPISFGLTLAAIVVDFRMQASGKFDPHIWLAPAEIKRAVHAMRQTLKISNDESDEMTWSMSIIQLLGDAPPSMARLKRFLNQPHSADATRLMTAMGITGLLSDRISSVLRSLDVWRNTDFAPPPLITGDDLTAAGALPGPKFKQALDAAYDAQLEGRIASKDEAMDLAMLLLTAKNAR
jgi:poly(A) polymerase